MNSDDEMNDGGMGCVWSVTVLRGRPMSMDRSPAPLVVDDAITVMVGGDDDHEDSHRLSYGPVALHSSGPMSLDLLAATSVKRSEYERQMAEHGRVQMGMSTVRTLHNASFDFDYFGGEIHVSGYEEWDDGSLHLAVWLISPFPFHQYMEDADEDRSSSGEQSPPSHHPDDVG